MRHIAVVIIRPGVVCVLGNAVAGMDEEEFIQDAVRIVSFEPGDITIAVISNVFLGHKR